MPCLLCQSPTAKEPQPQGRDDACCDRSKHPTMKLTPGRRDFCRLFQTLNNPAGWMWLTFPVGHVILVLIAQNEAARSCAMRLESREEYCNGRALLVPARFACFVVWNRLMARFFCSCATWSGSRPWWRSYSAFHVRRGGCFSAVSCGCTARHMSGRHAVPFTR